MATMRIAAALAWLMIGSAGCGSDCIDVNSDGVCDRDRCPESDVATDADQDGTPDPCDLCPGADDDEDVDADTIPDSCDVCADGDDTVDADGDTLPDACDVCPGSDDRVDSDGDTVADGCDVCATGSDRDDTDLDAVPDACDPCPADNPDDADGNLVCDSNAAYDLATVSEFTFGTDILSVNSFAIIVNTGSQPIDLSTLQIVSVTDDHPIARMELLTFGAISTITPPGEYSGTLTANAQATLITSGLVTEPAVAGPTFGFSLQLIDIPFDEPSDIQVTLDLVVGGSPVTVPLSIHFLPGGATTFDAGARLSAKSL